MSDAPINEVFYGVYGRNTGFLTYALLTLIMISMALLRSPGSFSKLLFGLFAAGITNTIYCAWVLLFGDFLPWNNQYGKILGLFGNPDFISAFLGIFTTALVAYSLQRGRSVLLRLATAVISCVALYEIIRSHAIQGLVVLAGGFLIIGFFLVRSMWESALPSWVYSVSVTVLGVLAILGTLQKGPLSFIYKKSVSLRGSYWHAGIEMGVSNPFFGVGFDAYGDWFRRARDTQALIMPGPNTVTNAAHNVPFDVFAFGGWPLFITYITILVLSVIAIVKVTVRAKKYDAIFVTLTTAWVCYQLQSIISINQIGLAIWGWLFGGALIAYEIATRPKKDSESAETTKGKTVSGHRVKSKQNEAIFSSTLLAGIGAVVGLLIGLLF
jgi:hypothetical protein